MMETNIPSRPPARSFAFSGQAVDIASLAAFRILFGLLMFAAMIRFLAKGWVRELYVDPVFHFTYPGFGWIRPWPDFWMHAHFVALALLALGISVGLLYRISAVLFFLGFTYVELLDQTAYLNHYYLISLLSGLLIFLPANCAWSVDAWLRPAIRCNTAPAWCLNLVRFQVAVVYVFAGLAKFNADWLFRAQPLRIWLSARSDLPLIGHWLEQTWVAYAASWFGAVFDTSIVFFLLFRHTRRPAYLVLILFHVATWLLFHIGMFPWIMIATATVLFPPDWPRYWQQRLRLPFPPAQAKFRANAGTPFPLALVPSRLFLSLYILVQLLLPLRPYLARQPAGWTCSGFNCAWQVMIVEKTGYSEFFAFDPPTGRRWKIPVKQFLTPRQKIMMDQDPYLVRDFARWLAVDLEKQYSRKVDIHVDAFATLNGRPSQRIIDPRTDLAGTLRGGWIAPLRVHRRSEMASLESAP
jgi:vitamin K-dependent gamma-carboxylase